MDEDFDIKSCVKNSTEKKNNLLYDKNTGAPLKEKIDIDLDEAAKWNRFDEVEEELLEAEAAMRARETGQIVLSKKDTDIEEFDTYDDAFSEEYTEKAGFSPLKKYVLTIAIILGIFAALSGALVFAYSLTKKDNSLDANAPLVTAVPADWTGRTESDDKNPETSGNAAKATAPPKDAGLFALPRKTTFLIIGVDESGFLADVDVVACYDSITKEFNLISIPRDTYTIVASDDLAVLSKYSGIPYDGIVKFNELHSYAGKTEGWKYLKKYAEKMLGVQIDYYVKIDLTAFRYIVDAVGGVYMEIRPEGLYHNDGDLRINVPGGYQKLDGKTAEGVVRFRSYRNGDEGRISVQHQFMAAFFSQVLSKEAITGATMSYFTMIRDYVETNFGVDDLLLYTEAFTHLSADNIHFYTTPGMPFETTRFGRNVSFYEYFPKETLELTGKIFNNYDLPEGYAATSAPKQDNVVKDIKKMNIQVLNGGNIDGKAAEVRDRLRAEGFTVKGLNNYAGTKHEETRIMTRDVIDATAIAALFKDASIKVDTSIDAQFDIIIIIGTGEK